MTFHTHLYLVHEQTIANVTPALDPRFRPSEVILLVSPDRKEMATWLEAALEPTGVKTARWDVDNAWDIEHLRDRVLESDEIALNVTGGTKPMSIAAYEVFRHFDKPIYYVHPERDYVIWMHPSERESFDLADRIKFPEYFAAHGMRIEKMNQNSGISENLHNLTSELIAQIELYSRALTALNKLASSAVGTLQTPLVEYNVPKLDTLIEMFSKQQLLRLEAGKLIFSSEENRFFTNGGWFEEHVYKLIDQLKREEPSVQDIGRSIHFDWDIERNSAKNEIDVALISDNRLYIIECKTKLFLNNKNKSKKNTNNIKKDNDTEFPAADALYKLGTLRDHLGGANAKAMLISYNNISYKDQQRAKELGIQICVSGGLRNLKSVLKKWIQKNKQ